MNQDDIIKLAREVGAHEKHGVYYLLPEELEHFYALVAAHERESCARVCDSVRDDWAADDKQAYHARLCAAAIRARTQL